MAISGLLIVCSILKILDKIPKNLKLLASLNYPLTPGHPMRMKAKRQLRLWEVLPKGAKIRKTINCGGDSVTTMLPMTDTAIAKLSKIGRQHELAGTHKCLGKGCYKVCGNAGALWSHQQRCPAFQSYMEEKEKQQARSQTRLQA